jgi:hypothetical protein
MQAYTKIIKKYTNSTTVQILFSAPPNYSYCRNVSCTLFVIRKILYST